MLTSKQRAFLKAEAHSKKPVVHIGKKGITDALVAETQQALLAHELIKVKFGEYEDKDAEGQELADKAGAELVGITGNVLTLYAPHPEKARLKLPKEKKKPAEASE